MAARCPKCGKLIAAQGESIEGQTKCPECGCDSASNIDSERFSEDESGFIVHQEVGYSASPEPGSGQADDVNSTRKNVL